MRSFCGPASAVSVLALFIVLGCSSALWAHGVSWSLSAKESYGLEFSFDDGSPMAFAEIKVFRPGADEAPSQIGRADKNGYYAFIPDGEGQWTVKADDGTGHLAQAQVNVAAQGVGSAEADQAQAAPVDAHKAIAEATKPFKIALVISVFLNLAAVVHIARRKKA